MPSLTSRIATRRLSGRATSEAFGRGVKRGAGGGGGAALTTTAFGAFRGPSWGLRARRVLPVPGPRKLQPSRRILPMNEEAERWTPSAARAAEMTPADAPASQAALTR